MAGRNGPAEAQKPVGVLELEDIAYERATIKVSINGTPRVFDGWVAGPGCPGRVSAEYARKVFEWETSPDGSRAPYIQFLTDALRVVLPDLGYEEADFLAGSGDRATAILTHLRWMAPVGEGAADPEAMGGASITDDSSPTSSPATAAPAPTAAAG
jgi:hypothetical protein